MKKKIVISDVKEGEKVYIWDNRVISTINIDINPSFQINLMKNNKIKNIKAYNKDAKDIISNNLYNKTLDEFFNELADKLIDKNIVEDNNVTILLYSSGNINENYYGKDIFASEGPYAGNAHYYRYLMKFQEFRKEILEKFIESFNNKEINIELIIIDKISKEDKELAKKYNISVSKASYINSIIKNNKEIKVDNLINREVKELINTKQSGNYCDNGYILEGDFCLKEIEIKEASFGKVCPNNYYEYNGKCYYEEPYIEGNNYVCNDEFKLDNDKCIRTEIIDSKVEYKCDKGELMKKGDVSPIGSSDKEKYYCIDKSTGVAPTLRCMIGPHIVMNGRCYVGPAPTINGGCPNGDSLVNGGCYSLDPEDQWQCPNGSIYEKSKGTYVDLCPDTFTYIEPTITGYTCQDGYDLKDNKCIKEEVVKAEKERYCPNGYTKVDYDRCINLNNTTDYLDGYKCNYENSRLKGNKCYIYEFIEAKHG